MLTQHLPASTSPHCLRKRLILPENFNVYFLNTCLQECLLCSKDVQLSFLSRCRRNTYPNSSCRWGGRVFLRVVHPFDQVESLSSKSKLVLLDLAVLSHVPLVKHPGPNHELVIRSRHFAFLVPPSVSPLFHLQQVHRRPLPAFSSGDMSTAFGSGISPFICKAIKPLPLHTDGLYPLPSSSISLTVGRNLCGAAPSTPACTSLLHVHNNIIWRKKVAYFELPKLRYDPSSQIRRSYCRAYLILCLLLEI